MPPSSASFERLKDKGLAAFRAEEYAKAKVFITEAAEQMIVLAGEARGVVREQREGIARDMIDLAKKCDRLKPKPKGKGGGKGTGAREDDEEAPDASEWMLDEKPDVGFDDIAGLADVKEEIRLKMIYPLRHPEVAAEYGQSAGGGILLYGPPGTGKTMIAKAIAKEIEASFFVISAAQILSKWVGEAEQRIKALFTAAKEEDCSVIFMDEIEAMVPKRGSNSSTVMARVVPQILQELEGFDRGVERTLLFVGATNKPWMLDEAMMRPGRFDTRVYIGLPDPPARRKMLELYLEGKPLDDAIDFDELCGMLDGYSGADIREICTKAASLPFREWIANGSDGKPRLVTMDDAIEIAGSIQPSVTSKDLKKYEQFNGVAA